MTVGTWSMGSLSLGDKLFVKEEYKHDPTRANIEFLAEKFEVSTRSIIAILTAAGLYKRPGYLTKSGEKPVSKLQLVDMIADAMSVDSSQLEGLEKSSKTTLRLLLSHLDEKADDYFKP